MTMLRSGVRARTFLSIMSLVALLAGPVFADGFPARTLFNARGVVQTPIGDFVTGTGNLIAAAGRSAYCPIATSAINSLPPFGSTYGAEFSPTLLFSVDDPNGPSVATIVSISHLVHGTVQSPGGAFPDAGIDVFPSTFPQGRIEFTAGPMAGTFFDLPPMTDPAQGVSRSAPFLDSGPRINDSGTLPVPPGSNLPTQVSDEDVDFFIPNHNGTGQQSIFLQIVSLDARSADGQFRIIAGRQMKEEYPDLFVPSFGIVVSNSPALIPTLSEWGVIILVLLLTAAMITLRVRFRQRSTKVT